MSALRMLALVGLLGAGWACAREATPAAAPQARVDPGPLRPPSVFGPDVQWRQRVTATWPAGERTFDAVLSKEGDELLLLGLDPLGRPGFVVRLQGERVTVENRTPHELPFDPEYIMLDVQRVFFPWGEPGAGVFELDGERVSEVWREGRLVERRFRRVDGQPPGEIVVRYEGWAEGADAPQRAVLDHGWLGYRLVIETLQQQRL